MQPVHCKQRLCRGSFGREVLLPSRAWSPCRHLKSPDTKYVTRSNLGSFPLTHASTADVLQKRPTTPTLKNYAISYLRDHTKSFDYTLGVMDELESQIRADIARLGGNPQLEKIIDVLHVQRPS